jgi:hypothetical protein
MRAVGQRRVPIADHDHAAPLGVSSCRMHINDIPTCVSFTCSTTIGQQEAPPTELTARHLLFNSAPPRFQRDRGFRTCRRLTQCEMEEPPRSPAGDLTRTLNVAPFMATASCVGPWPPVRLHCMRNLDSEPNSHTNFVRVRGPAGRRPETEQKGSQRATIV